MSDQNLWWKGAVVYQIYPRSFFDSNNDGVGDLQGISNKLDYVASLGVDALWISPFFQSPMKDFGYDISDYRDVDPIYGSLSDFKNLVDQAHSRNLKVIVDQVISHSSDQHKWFKESGSDSKNQKADWYVWADKTEAGPPNNWLSFFGGSAWTWHPGRQQYFLHNFLSSQPDLNFHNSEVRQAHLDNIEFWLKLGVDGVRLDVVNFYYHDRLLRDNPSCEKATKVGVDSSNPYSGFQHIYDITRPENISFLNELRELLDRYPGSTSIGEINAEDDLGVMAEYTGGDDRLHMAYTFDLLGDQKSAAYIHTVISKFEERVSDGWPCWALSNHDVARVASRWADEDGERSKLYLALLLSLRGSVCLYQGEELGLPEAKLDFEELVDPYGIEFWPKINGRDGCRTPIPWISSANGGFNLGARSWLPTVSEHLPLSVESQDSDEDSQLHFTRRLLAYRSQHPELATGTISLLPLSSGLLAWVRELGSKKTLCAFNLSDVAVEIPSTWGVKAVDFSTDGSIPKDFNIKPWRALFCAMN